MRGWTMVSRPFVHLLTIAQVSYSAISLYKYTHGSFLLLPHTPSGASVFGTIKTTLEDAVPVSFNTGYGLLYPSPLSGRAGVLSALSLSAI